MTAWLVGKFRHSHGMGKIDLSVSPCPTVMASGLSHDYEIATDEGGGRSDQEARQG